jgi:hypothetical protein
VDVGSIVVVVEIVIPSRSHFGFLHVVMAVASRLNKEKDKARRGDRAELSFF